MAKVPNFNYGGNNKLLMQEYQKVRKLQNEFKAQVDKIVPEIYSCFVLTLKNHGYSDDDIEKLILETQDLWNECVEKEIDMPEWCLQETGIEIQQI